MPNRSHKPTGETREAVKALAGFGVTEDEIALYIGIAPKTLRKHYREELDTGHIHANAAVARSLYYQAVNQRNTSAAIFWLKARANWRDRQDIALSDPDGQPLGTGLASTLSSAITKANQAAAKKPTPKKKPAKRKKKAAPKKKPAKADDSK